MPSCCEQETVIQYNRDDKHATIYASDSTTITKLDRLCNESPEFYSLTKVEKDREGKIVGKFYKLHDKSLISFRAKKIKKEMTEEQKNLLKERFAKARNISSAQAGVWE